MFFLRLLSFYRKHLSPQASLLYPSIVMNSSPQIFFQPVQGKLEVRPGHRLRVWVFGTTWSARWYGSVPKSPPVDGQKIIIVGRQGICLLITLDAVQVDRSAFDSDL